MWKEKFANLIDLKSIITIIVCIAMVIFTGIGIIGSEMFIAVGTSVFTYFFTKKKENEVIISPPVVEPKETIGFKKEE